MTVSLLLMRSYFSLIHSLPRSATHLLSVAHWSHGGGKKVKNDVEDVKKNRQFSSSSKNIYF